MATVLVILFIAVLALVLIYPERSAAAISRVSAVVFLALAVVALTAVAAPGLYESLAERSLEVMGVRAQIEAMDDRLVLNDLADISEEIVAAVETVSESPTSVLDAAAAAIRGIQGIAKGEAEQGEGQAGAAPGEGTEGAAAAPSQILMDNVYPSLVAACGVMLQFGALVASLAGLMALTAIHLAAVAARKLRVLSSTQADIEARLRALEGAGGPGSPQDPSRAAPPA